MVNAMLVMRFYKIGLYGLSKSLDSWLALQK